VSTAAKVRTREEFLALPEDGHDRDLILGEVWERPAAYKDRHHASVAASLSFLLEGWSGARPEPRGEVVGGAGFDMTRAPDTLVGIDVAYVGAETVAATPETADFFQGVPVLAVEILSPSDPAEEVARKVEVYRSLGVVVWEVDPSRRFVTVHRPDHPPVASDVTQQLDGEPYLPGFRVAVADVFA